MAAFFKIGKNGIEKIKEKQFEKSDNVISVVSIKEFKENSLFRYMYGMGMERGTVRCCRIIQSTGNFAAEFRIPSKIKNENAQRFKIGIINAKIVCIQDTGELNAENQFLHELILKIANQKKAEQKNTEKKSADEYTKERFLYDLLNAFIADDWQYMEKLEKMLTVLEEEVFHGGNIDFNSNMLQLKKKIFQFYRYYTQLIEMAAVLEGNEAHILNDKEVYIFGKLKEKTQRLAAETQVLRECAVEVQEVYQSELGIRQNHIMKILTTVTTVFLPLTLIAGWYGMNFTNMPELTWKYGYPLIAAVSCAIFGIVMWVFKKKGFW